MRAFTIFPFIVALQVAAQSVIVSTSLSLENGFTGNRVPATITHPIPITITVGGSTSTPQVTGSQAQNNTVSAGGNSTASTPVTSAPVTSSTMSTTLPKASPTTLDPNLQAPFPGATQAGVNMGPDDSYVSAALPGAKVVTVLAVGLVGLCLGVGEVVALL